MNRITLNNNIQMPMLGFGTFLMGGSECEESVLAAIRSGYRMIDTAEAYGNEEAVGNAIVKSGIPREELFLVTKVNFRSYENTRETVEASLNKLKTSYLDLVLLHWPFGNYYAAWRELEKMYHEGKIRAIGVSNFDPGRLIDLIEFNEVVPAVNQIETHLLCQRRAEHEWLEKYHVQHMAYAPLGQGRKNEMFENPDLVEIAKTHGKTAAQIALRYLMQSGVIVIPKSVHTERIKENFELFDFALTAGEMERLVSMDTASSRYPHRVQAGAFRARLFSSQLLEKKHKSRYNRENTGGAGMYQRTLEKGASVVPILQSICQWAGVFYKDEGKVPMIQCHKCDHRG